jgi:hypothetical protein
MAGFAAALGGAGQAVQQYGAQMRPILEQRRSNLADLIAHIGDNATDPGLKAAAYSAAGDLHAGKDLGKVLPAFMKTAQAHAQNTAALGQAGIQLTGGPPPPPQQMASLTPPGGTPGTATAPVPNQPNPAAQPGTNPIAGPATIQGLSGASALDIPNNPAPISPVPSASPAAALSPLSPASMDPFLQDLQSQYHTAAASGFGIPSSLQTAVAPLIQHSLALQQEQSLRQMDLSERQTAFNSIHNSPSWNDMPGWMQSQWTAWAHSRSAPLPALPIGALRPVNPGGVIPSSQISDEERLDINGKPIPVSSPFVRQHMDLMNRRIYYSPATGPETTAISPTGARTSVPNLPGADLGTISGIVSAENRPREAGVDAAGHPTFQSVAEMQSGAAPAVGAGRAPAFIPTQSTNVTQIPGQLPETRTTRTVKGGSSASSPAPLSPTSPTAGPTTTPTSSLPPSSDPSIRQAYSDWQGGGPAPTGKKLIAVDTYRAQNNLPLPVTLSATGQANLQSVDAVDMEIKDALESLDKIKGNPMLGVDYMRYKHLGQSTPYDDLFTKLSFEGLRSAATALKGNNSRAYPIIQRAFEHVPNLDRFFGANPDSVSLMKDKLHAMQGVLDETRQSVLSDERKSGTIMPATGGTKTFNDNGKTYQIPVSLIDAFQRDHPNAR